MTRVAGLLVGAVLLGGCGGGDDTSATSQWAGDVCSAITTWTDSISSATQSLQGGNLSQDSLESAVDDVKEATKTFADDLQDLDEPDTESGEQAQESIDQLADDVSSELDGIESALEDAEGASGVLAAVSVVSASLVTMGEQASATFSALEQLDPAGELESAFEEADSCADLRSGS